MSKKKSKAEPGKEQARILLAHGDGGLLTRRLVEEVFLANFDNPELHPLSDAAAVTMKTRKIAFTTDSHVVKPIFYPGGDIGALSVYGTCNDLAVTGARPEYLSCGFIIEEGLDISSLGKIVESMRTAASSVPVKIVAGDTKVVEKGFADKVFINTSGVGTRLDWPSIGRPVTEGDSIILTGGIAEHGVAVLAARGELPLQMPVKSDCASIWPMVEALHAEKINVKWMRDPTRGGVATAICELVKDGPAGAELYEDRIPVTEQVASACEILGLDPLYLANEGKMLVVVKSGDSERALEVLKSLRQGKKAAVVGVIKREHAGRVILRTAIGGARILGLLSGNPLPRIC